MASNTRSDNSGRRRGLWRVPVWGGAAALLLAPLVMMRVSDEVVWTGSDFAIFGVMLAIPLGILELTVRATGSLAYRAAVVIALGAGFLMTWVNLAVGIIGNEENPLNLMFFGILAIGVVGAVVARFKPRGMAGVMVVMAAAQVVSALVALTSGDFAGVLFGFFLATWLASAWLFHKAATDPASAPAAG